MRLLPVLAAATLALSGLAACGSNDSTETDASTATSGTVNWWGWTPTDTATANAYIAAFNQKFPDIKVNYKLVNISDWVAALRPALASGNGPDVFDMQPGAYVAQFKSFAEDQTKLAEDALGAGWKDKVAPIGISGLSADGKLTAMSVGSVYAGMLWLNGDIFKKYNLTAPTTLAEWKHVCSVLKQNKVGCFVQGAAQEGFDQDTLQSIANSVQPGLWSKASTGDAKWTDPGIVKTLAIWKDLFDSGIMQEGAVGYQQYPDANNDFLTGKYGMIMMGTWYTQYATTKAMTAALSAAGVSGAKPFPILPAAFPDVAGAGNTSEMYGDADFGLAISTKSKNKAAAETFVKWMATSSEGQQAIADQLNDIPSLKGVEPDFNKIELVDPATQKGPVEDLITKSGAITEPRESLLSADVQTGILAAATSVATGKSSPEDAAKALQQAAEAAGVTFK
ncbi:ABC transporter substrate-binding protein [Paractinoplanes toevensis]|uniref:ABC transporter substrate-binding protein n=1 Tax=Paractinoplanes toevensis TaxID=571911 RepID=A0A919TAA4_9ACTN|nr:ABC transporter substrate-binding protein [Actinoplanes toevensis]GIM90569.1 ABC transporter substrate-binding protein [Actinoplanes toevensis]